MWGARSGRVRPTRERARLGRGDRWRAVGLGSVALAAALTSAAVVLPTQEDPVGAAERERSELAEALAQQLRPVFTELRREAAALVTSAAGSPRDGTLPRWYWVTDDAGMVVETGPATSSLLGRQRPVPERAAVLRGQPVVGRVTRDPLLGATVLLVHARSGGGRILTAAVPAAGAGVLGLPQRPSEATRVALVAGDGTIGRDGGREPADASLLGAVQAATAGSSVVRYAGEGEAARLAAVAAVGDGWNVVAEGDVPGDGGRRTRAATRLTAAGLALLATFAALALVRGAVGRTARRAEAVQQALLTVTGHELRTPLTIIIGSTRTLTSRWDRLDDTKRKELAAAVGRQAKQLDRLVERLLHAGRLAAGQRSQLSIRAVDVGAVATGVLDDVRRLSPLHEFRLDDGAGTVRAASDERGLTQVLEHLLDNAVKYSPDGGEVLVEVRAEGRLQRRVRVSVSDQGVGLPADTSRLFRAFGQSQDVNTRTTEEGGVGVGLSIVKDLVTAMGGSVHAERRPVGSTFVVVLPVTSD